MSVTNEDNNKFVEESIEDEIITSKISIESFKIFSKFIEKSMNLKSEKLEILNKVNVLLIDDSQERLTKSNIDRYFLGKFVNPET